MSDNTSRQGVWDLTQAERLKLATWLFSLDASELSELARRRLAVAFPTAPECMIHTAEHHLFVDGKDAALAWIAGLARFLQSQDSDPPDRGHDWDFLHHLYNWWQFRALLPEGKPNLLEHIKEAQEFINEGSLDAALAALKNAEEALDGNLDCPEFDN